MLKVCLISLVIPFAVFVSCLSINTMIRQRYDKAAFVISTAMLLVFFIGMVVCMIWLMSGFVKRISHINKQMYSVADCVVTGRTQQRSPRHNHCFVTVIFPDGNSQEAMASASVFALAENGKRALLLKYDEPEGRNKLPFEIAVV